MKFLQSLIFASVSFLATSNLHAATYYYHTDHLGTPQAVTDINQTVVWRGNYDPFGEVTEQVALVEQNIRFPGQYFDQETGLHYNYFRDYDTLLGRYIESDPIGLDGGINTFLYVSNKPLNRVDIFGLAESCKWVIEKVYEKQNKKLVSRAEGEYVRKCKLTAKPSMTTPSPYGGNPRRPGFPGDIEFGVECDIEWVWTKEAVYEYSYETWTKGIMECTDDCTGKKRRFWGPNRPLSTAGDIT